MEIFIPFNTPSSKNSKSKYGVLSKPCQKYLQKIGVKKYRTQTRTCKKTGVTSYRGVENYKTRANLFAIQIKPLERALRDSKPPHVIEFHFVRDSRRKFDFHNIVQIVADLMVAHGVIEDDNMDYFIPYPLKINGLWYTIDKENAGVLIRLMNA